MVVGQSNFEQLTPTLLKFRNNFFFFLLQKLGNGLRAAAKSQINLVMSEVPGVKQAEGEQLLK
jgi:hypothetical protein